MTDSDLLDSIEDLEQHYNAPGKSSRGKVSTALTEAMQRWLAHSPFFVIATYSATGLDCSPRGDECSQAFRILDAHTIAIPDRRGNGRIDTLRNLLEDARIGLLFLIPGIEETLRIKGEARISINNELRQSFAAAKDEMPATVILVEVQSAFVQNARALRRSGLWDSDTHVDAVSLPDFVELTTNIIRRPE